MGFYLPGIGEALGGAIRMNRQNELMQQSQSILKDDTKPWAERVALITAAHPELATNPQLQAMLEAGRQADQDKMARTKFDQEQAAAASAQRFQDLLGKTPPEQQRELIMNNPDMASRVVPELLKTYQAEEEAIKEEDRWLRRNELTSAQKDRRAAVAAGAVTKAQELALEKEMRAGVASGAIDPQTGMVVPYAQRQDAAQARTLETAKLKSEQTKYVADVAAAEASNEFAKGLEEYRDLALAARSGVGFASTEDKARLATMRTELATLKAKADAGGGLTTQDDIDRAEALIPENTLTTDDEYFKAALTQLAESSRKAPPPPPGFKVQKR